MRKEIVTEHENEEEETQNFFVRFVNKWVGKFVVAMFATWIIVGSVSLFLLYGPWDGFRTFMITSTETTINHKYISRIFFSDERIQKEIISMRIFRSSAQM